VKATLLLLAMIACTVTANLLLKLGSGDVRSPLLLGLLSARTALGLGVFGCAGLFYSWALRFLPLNVAQSYAAAQFIAVIIASRLMLGEPIPLTRWAGIAMIALGIVVIAYYEA